MRLKTALLLMDSAAVRIMFAHENVPNALTVFMASKKRTISAASRAHAMLVEHKAALLLNAKPTMASAPAKIMSKADDVTMSSPAGTSLLCTSTSLRLKTVISILEST